MKLIKDLLRIAIKLFFLTVCLAITVFIFLNSYETLFNKDIKYVNAIKEVQINSLLQSISSRNQEKNIFISVSNDFIGNFGIPYYLKIPKIESGIQLTSAIKSQDEKWLCRSNVGHYLFFSKNKKGNLGDMLIYVRKSWRTINNVDQISKGDNIFIDTLDEWRYMYRVNEIKKLTTDDLYIVSESNDSTLMIVIVEDNNQTNYVINANFVSVQYIK